MATVSTAAELPEAAAQTAQEQVGTAEVVPNSGTGSESDPLDAHVNAEGSAEQAETPQGEPQFASAAAETPPAQPETGPSNSADTAGHADLEESVEQGNGDEGVPHTASAAAVTPEEPDSTDAGEGDEGKSDEGEPHTAIAAMEPLESVESVESDYSDADKEESVGSGGDDEGEAHTASTAAEEEGADLVQSMGHEDSSDEGVGEGLALGESTEQGDGVVRVGVPQKARKPIFPSSCFGDKTDKATPKADTKGDLASRLLPHSSQFPTDDAAQHSTPATASKGIKGNQVAPLPVTATADGNSVVPASPITPLQPSTRTSLFDRGGKVSTCV